jgi:hypothetical protein
VSGHNQLFSINVDGTGLTQLTNTVGVNLFPAPGWLRVRTECGSLDFSRPRRVQGGAGASVNSLDAPVPV